MHTEANKEPMGILAVAKPAGMTSHDVVGKLRRLYHTKKVGHTGTLDPMATGVLVLLVGRAAKAAEFLTLHDKHYEATLKLGLTTDTEDTTGKVLTVSEKIPDEEAVRAVARRYQGIYKQVPPMYSALKVNGKKLVDLARRGIEVAREAREVQIYALHLAATDKKEEYLLSVHCSSGTYIRTLCADIGKDLGCGGVMATLCRTAVGGISLSSAVSLDALEAMSDEERVALLSPVETLFSNLSSVALPPFFEHLARNGCEIYQSKIKTDFQVNTRLRLTDEQHRFFGLGEVREYPDGTAVKVIKLFDIQ